MKVTKLLILLTMLTVTSYCIAANQQELDQVLTQLHLAPGFKISLYSTEVPNARSLALAENGTVFVGTRSGEVYALQDQDNDGKAEHKYLIGKDLNLPNGVAYKGGDLYVAEIHRIIKYKNILQNLLNPPAPNVVYAKFPTDKHHGWKYLRFGPDGKLYTAVGAPCNICDPKEAIYASLLRLDSDGSHFEILANGIRNTVGFDWEPKTQQLFFNDNGRDMLGDDVPPEELNLWTKPKQHFGYPYCHAGTILDPEYGKAKHCADYTAPVWTYKAHVAPLGMRFYTGTQFPETYRQQLFVAQHGSWNRTFPQGYQIALLRFKDGKPIAEESFISGWLTVEGQTLGRPVDLLQTDNGSLLISDDKLGVIYKVEYAQ